MEIVQRILNKIVGEELSADEMELIAGGMVDTCPHQCKTWEGDAGGPIAGCDC